MFSETQPWGTGDPQPWITEKYGPAYRPIAFRGLFMTMDWGPVSLMYRNVAQRTNAITGLRELKSIPLDDAVLPVQLQFPVPLLSRAQNGTGFRYQWQKLTYAFRLPSPAAFPTVSVSAGDREIVMRYIRNCEILAEYSIFNDDANGITISTNETGTSITGPLPSSEAFTGASARFRQLHNDQEEASFVKVRGILRKALKAEGPSKRARGEDVVKRWSAARAQLDRKMLSTIISELLLPAKDDPDAEGPNPSLAGVEPAKLIRTYNYGDTLHWGDRREDLAKLNDDDDLETFWMHCVVNSMLALGHTYFGFSVAARAALGINPARAASSTTASRK